jgi:hypothetical protein
VPNLVLILDGFDELVMASRARLRNFFNVLTEELTSGPLRFARAIVSGRDTLFPNGDGLPVGSHVLTLKPFDEPRVAIWGKKWRSLHRRGAGGDFTPEKLLPDNTSRPRPLAHLASWPLTLHLLARVHTSGTLNLGTETGPEVEKPFLYCSIMADTARRQTAQASGKGRFDQHEIRRFLRHLAWEMYSRGTDSLEFSEVVPLIRELHPALTEADVSEITDVAIVNAPELTKGEETGCEFVHKSFSEYLVAEHVAETVERAAFKAAEFGSPEPTWRMSDGDATAELAAVFASRLITPEVQEMLEPMLGRVRTFYDGTPVARVLAAPVDPEPLTGIIERLEMMLTLLAQGRLLDVIAKRGAEEGLADTALVAFANYCAGLMIVGTATARRASNAASSGGSEDAVYFNGEPSPGTFWRCVGLLEAGGLAIGPSLGSRLFTHMTVMSSTDRGKPPANRELDERSFPVQLAEFQRLHGYWPVTTTNITNVGIYSSYLALTFLLSAGLQAREERGNRDQGLPLMYRAYETVISNLLSDLAELADAGVSSSDSFFAWHETRQALRRMIDAIEYGPQDRVYEVRFHDALRSFDNCIRFLTRDFNYGRPFEGAHLMLHHLADEYLQAARQRDARQHQSEPGQPLPPGVRGSQPSSPPPEEPEEPEETVTPPAG